MTTFPLSMPHARLGNSGFEAASIAMGDDSERFIDTLVAPGTTAVPHYIDPAYPPEGRPRAEAYRRPSV